ncbi:MAG: energy-coupling factor transporter transmembrane component T family protein, partial [Thermoprotei archaeon]
YGKSKALRPLLTVIAGIQAIMPTIVYLFRGAQTLAISADTRGFRARNSRTSLVELKFVREDYVMWGVIVGLIALDVVANLLGFGRSIPYTGL